MVQKLLAWFASNARALPWRQTHHPYPIWVSEIMLQQTQVKTVLPYWERWMKTLSTVQELAEAPIDTILKLWEGLGYYSRVRNLQKAAQVIVRESNGLFPDTVAGWLALPGIGRYTAGAICSIAFDQPVPVLDGNVVRVLCRYFGYRQDPKNTLVNRKLWKQAENLVQQAKSSSLERPCAAFNQSLMELGALICRAQNPLCPSCPLKEDCKAFRDNKVHLIPATSNKPKNVRQYWTCWILVHRGHFLIRRRETERINRGLWEFPTVVTYEKPKEGSPLYPKEWSFQLHDIKCVGNLQHNITNHRIHIRLCQASVFEMPIRGNDAIWKTFAELILLPWSGAHRKIVKMIEQGRIALKS